MSEQKFYWIKLKTDFFNQPAIDFLMGQKNGSDYVVLYQILCLNTANNQGELSTRVGEIIIPYDVDKIVRDTRYFSRDTVVIALELFRKLGLIYEQEGIILKISNFENLIGSESKWAKKKRDYRKKQKQIEGQSCGQTDGQYIGQDCGHCEDIVRQEIDIEIEKDIDIENKYNSSNQSTSSNEYKLSNQSTSSIAQTSKKESEPEAETEAILLNDGSEWKPTVTMFDEYKRLFPAVDVERQIAAMRAWSLANPSKRKTRSGVNRFVTNWLSKEQNKGGSNSRSGTTRIGSQLSNEEWRQMWEDA